MWNSCYIEELIVCFGYSVVAMYPFRALNVCRLLLEVRLKSAMALIDGKRVEMQTSWKDFVGLGSVLNWILFGLYSFTTPCATGFMVSELDPLELG